MGKGFSRDGNRVMKRGRVTVTAMLAALTLAVSLSTAHALRARWNLPPLPPMEKFGDVLIQGTSHRNGQRSVLFSHVIHRVRHTCRVCHLELGFAMKADGTTFDGRKNHGGNFCGACHDGKESFDQSEEGRCGTCHNGGEREKGWERSVYRAIYGFPEAEFGNEVDWTRALSDDLLSPRQSILEEDFEGDDYDESYVLQSDYESIAPVTFSHKSHLRWLDCDICHPDIFDYDEPRLGRFDKKTMIAGKSCGACHLKVAFPLDDCHRCH